MSATRTFAIFFLLSLVLFAAGALLWHQHVVAWGIGGRGGPVLSYDAAEYAVAARELAERGRLATPYALPLELSKHSRPPWPLAIVQPGLVLVEAAGFAASPLRRGPETRERLVLVFPLLCYLATGIALALATLALLRKHAPDVPDFARVGAGLVAGLAFLLDPEAQHLASGGFTEPPFTLGLVGALAALALGFASRHPLLFGLLIGVTGAFRGNMLWLAPILALATALGAPGGTRRNTIVRVLGGYAIPLLPWWVYKWSAFGSAAWDLSWLSIWDGVEGHTWFSLNHLPELPALPSGAEGVGLISRKVLRNLPAVLLALFTGARALWIGAIAIWLLAARRDESAGAGRAPRPLYLAAGAALAILLASALVAAATVPQSRYLFPVRVVAEAAGLLAVWGLVMRFTDPGLGRAGRAALAVAVAVLALGWGGWQTMRGTRQTRAISEERGVPGPAAMAKLAEALERELGPDEPVMSNLGPILAWYARRPVVHLALTPADVRSCRERLDLRRVLLVFREPQRAWPGWSEVVERPGEASAHPEWDVTRTRTETTSDGFLVVWLELGPLQPPLAGPRGRRHRRDFRIPAVSSSVSAIGFDFVPPPRPRATRFGTSASPMP